MGQIKSLFRKPVTKPHLPRRPARSHGKQSETILFLRGVSTHIGKFLGTKMRTQVKLATTAPLGRTHAPCLLARGICQCNAYAPCCDVICGPLGLHYIFVHYLIHGAIFGKMLLNTNCIFLFSLQLLPKTFLILRIV
jgi:hypothetical protein